MDKQIEVAIIIGTCETEDKEELKFIKNMNDMFSDFVKTGLLTKGNDLSFEKMYLVDSDNILSKDKSSPLGKSPVLTKVKKMSFMLLMNFNSSSFSVSKIPKMAAASIVLFAIPVTKLNGKSMCKISAFHQKFE